MNILQEVTSQPRYLMLTGLGIIAGAGLGWVIHWQFPIIPWEPAMFYSAVTCGAIVSLGLIVRHTVAAVQKLADEFKQDAESGTVENGEATRPDPSAPAPNPPKD